GVIQARVVIHGERLVARARILASVPDFAPDRRPFLSFADDLADRDLPPLPPLKAGEDGELEQTEAEIADLFERVFETVSQMNLDATRFHGIENNASDPPPVNYPDLPQMDQRSMSNADVPPEWNRPFGDELLRDFPPQADSVSVPGDRLPY